MRARLPAAAFAAVAAVAVAALTTAPAALAVSPTPGPSGPAPAASAVPAAPASAAAPAVPAAPALSQAARLAVGGTQLAGSGLVVNYPATGAQPLPSVPASAYVIADAGSGQVLAARDPHGEFAPASTLKVLTAITLIPRLNPDATVTATALAASVQPNIVGLIPGHQYKVADLFRALLLISANDAAVALTQATGSFDAGMRLINVEAQHLQAYDVLAKQPNGLPAAGQVVSAYDEALIARQALSMPAFMSYDSALSATFPVKPGRNEALVNQNSLLRDYKGGIGGKIGWTEASGATYIGMARRNGVTLIVTVLHCTPLQEIIAGEKLLSWGFANDGKVRPVGTLVKPLPATTVRKLTKAQRAAAEAAARARGTADLNRAETRTTLTDVGLAFAGGLAVALAIATAIFTRSRRREARAMFPHDKR